MLSLIIFSLSIISLTLYSLYLKFRDYIEFLKLNREIKEEKIKAYQDQVKSFANLTKMRLESIEDLKRFKDHELYNILSLNRKLYSLMNKVDGDVITLINKYEKKLKSS